MQENSDGGPARKNRILKDMFGFDAFRVGQEQAVDALISGRNVLTVMPTGSGKSLCFQVPALVLGGLTIVISPLVALMHDQVAALQLIGVAADTINSARTRDDNIAVWEQVKSGDIRLLYLSPERLMTARMLAALKPLPVKLIAVDEAHCISRWGPAFRPDYESLSHLRSHFPNVPIAALTATADEATRQDICGKLFQGEADIFVLGFDRPNIRLQVGPKQSWKKQLLAFLQDHHGDSGIVYCLSRKKCEQTAGYLAGEGFDALSYHAGMDKELRDANQNTFMSRSGTIMVATIAFGMGIDKSDVRFVFHTDLPGNMETYYQEIGRAGRDGAPAVAQMLYGLDDIRMRRMFIENEDSEQSHKMREHKRLDALIGYCEAPECRRQTLLDYFGDETTPCGNCDICLNPMERRDGTVEAQMILSGIYRTGQMYGAAHIVDLLRGSLTAKITQANHDKLPTFGVGADHKAPHWRTLIRQLVAARYLALDIQGYGGLSITQKGTDLLKNEGTFRYRPDLSPSSSPNSSKSRGKMQISVNSTSPDRSGTESLSPIKADMLLQLKALRLELAREQNVPAFVIFPDRTLIDMVQKWPKTEAEFAEVSGVGDKKSQKFATPFLTVLSAGKSA